MSNFKMLVVEDDIQLREAIVDTLSLQNITVVEAGHGEEALSALKSNTVDMILSDVSMSPMDGFELLIQVKSLYPTLPFVLMTAYGEVEKAVHAIQLGAMDYLVKPFDVDVLVETVNQFRVQSEGPINLDEPVAEAPSSRALLKLAKQVANSDATVMLCGESGTGKEVLARYIHQNSPRKKGPFVAINCAAIPENMLEAMLFGYEKGAFTGAYNSMPGKFEQANEGTILLDEISEMDIGLQAKLLRVLQEHEVERLAGRKPIALNVRVIATTNRDLASYVKEKKFREDLYYRLSVFPLQWKALRQRRQDILPIAELLLKKHCKKLGRSAVILDDSAQNKLLSHPWPGNVRELENVIQRALIVQTGNHITTTDIVLDIDNFHSEELAETIELNDQDGLGDNLKQREYCLIIEALKNERSKKDAAEKLGISPRTLRYKMARMREEGINIEHGSHSLLS